MSKTVNEFIIESLRKALYHNRDEMTAPAAILWTDHEKQWSSIIPRLRSQLPHLLTLGPYQPETKTGPAVWIRCMVARSLAEANWAEGVVPIIYLPGISRQELRAVEDCPKELQPIVELQYRGVLWTQINAKDWSVLALLTSKDGGFGLDIARDNDTIEAMLRSLSKLIDTRISDLEGHKLEAADFNKLLQPDPTRDLLRWLDNQQITRESFEQNEWDTFCKVCESEYEFHPEKDGPLVAAEKLGLQAGKWKQVWNRYRESFLNYPSIPDFLRKAKPASTDTLFDKSESWPQDNEAAEDELRSALKLLEHKTLKETIAEISHLERVHSHRRDWIWTRLGKSPLVSALDHLFILSELCSKKLPSATAESIAEGYITGAWKADLAVLFILAVVEHTQDYDAVTKIIRNIYAPWLESNATMLQEKYVKNPPAPQKQHSLVEGELLLFVDGLRFDVSKRLSELLEQDGHKINHNWDWAAFPPVTPTAKPKVSPIADQLVGADTSIEFKPTVQSTGKELTSDSFSGLLRSRGIQYLSSTDLGDVSGRAWSECGEIDSNGHKHGWKLTHLLKRELEDIRNRIRDLFEAGWKQITIVTDHGWLLMPGGLPKTDLPKYLAETRWSRCATLKGTSQSDLQLISWYWNPAVYLAIAPGINTFKAGLEYSHGSVSPQEMIIPWIVVNRAKPVQSQSRIESAKWVQLRCRVNITGVQPGLAVDLRMKAGDPKSSITKSVVTTSTESQVSLLVEEPDLVGQSAIIVLLDHEGNTIHKMATIVGEN